DALDGAAPCRDGDTRDLRLEREVLAQGRRDERTAVIVPDLVKSISRSTRENDEADMLAPEGIGDLPLQFRRSPVHHQRCGGGAVGKGVLRALIREVTDSLARPGVRSRSLIFRTPHGSTTPSAPSGS